MNKQLVIIQRTLIEYRVSLFDDLYAELMSHDIHLRVFAGQSKPGEYLQEFTDEREWLIRVRNVYLPGGFYYQIGIPPCFQEADMIVFEQSSKFLSSYYFMLKRRLLSPPPVIAYWGHGVDFSDQKKFSPYRFWKRLWLQRVDYWFAYTDATATILLEAGYPSEQTTVLNNASNTEALKAAVCSVGEIDKNSLFQSLWHEQRHDSHRVGIFCSRLLASKGVTFLLESARLAAERFPDFRLLIIGDGPLLPEVRAFASVHPWCVLVPPVFGTDRAPCLALSDIWLNPGTTGLAIVDAYAAGLPFLTSDIQGHGPEIAYLCEEAGISVACDPHVYADTILDILGDDQRLLQRKKIALSLADRFTLKNMVTNFTTGILSCLDSETH